MKVPSAKIPMAKAKAPTVATPKGLKSAMSGKATVTKPAIRTNGQVVTGLGRKK